MFSVVLFMFTCHLFVLLSGIYLYLLTISECAMSKKYFPEPQNCDLANGNIPSEILWLIFSYVPEDFHEIELVWKNRETLSMVCKKWFLLLNSIENGEKYLNEAAMLMNSEFKKKLKMLKWNFTASFNINGTMNLDAPFFHNETRSMIEFNLNFYERRMSKFVVVCGVHVIHDQTF